MHYNRGSVALTILIVAILFVLGFAGVFFWKTQSTSKEKTPAGTAEQELTQIDPEYELSDEDTTDVILQEVETSVLEDFAADIAELEAELAKF